METPPFEETVPHNSKSDWERISDPPTQDFRGSPLQTTIVYTKTYPQEFRYGYIQ